MLVCEERQHKREESAAHRLGNFRIIFAALFPEFSDQNPKFYPQLSIYSWISFPKW